MAVLSLGEVSCYFCSLSHASHHPFHAEGVCGFQMLPRAWGHAEPAWGWEADARWSWQGGLQPNMAGTSLSCAGLGWDILAWLGSLLQGRPLQGLPAR